MKNETRIAVYDSALQIEAYSFEGIIQPFPNHFHEYYVIGFVESGKRILACKEREFTIKSGDMLIFNPGDNHACTQCGGALYYLGMNITKEVMLGIADEITESAQLPVFSKNVVCDGSTAHYFKLLHGMIMSGSADFSKEENLIFLMTLLLEKYAAPFERSVHKCRQEVEAACRFIEQHYSERISLEEICRAASISKSTLIRAFTQIKGVTPYNYLLNIRIGRAKKLLEQGEAPIDVALLTGFSDQSHFTNCFNRFIGLTPGAYREIFMDRYD